MFHTSRMKVCDETAQVMLAKISFKKTWEMTKKKEQLEFDEEETFIEI